MTQIIRFPLFEGAIPNSVFTLATLRPGAKVIRSEMVLIDDRPWMETEIEHPN
jgi:hypothetical protein